MRIKIIWTFSEEMLFLIILAVLIVWFMVRKFYLGRIYTVGPETLYGISPNKYVTG